MEKPAIAVTVSRDAKTGPVAATYAAQASCPPECRLKKICYGNKGHCRFTTNRLNRAAEAARATALDVARAEVAAIEAMAVARIDMRAHVVGDGRTAKIAGLLGDAYRGYRVRAGGSVEVWNYTHAWWTVPREAWGPGVNILASADSLDEVALARARGYGACAVVLPELPRAGLVDGMRLMPCVYQATGRKVQCVRCRLCLDETKLARRGAVVAFKVH